MRKGVLLVITGLLLGTFRLAGASAATCVSPPIPVVVDATACAAVDDSQVTGTAVACASPPADTAALDAGCVAAAVTAGVKPLNVAAAVNACAPSPPGTGAQCASGTVVASQDGTAQVSACAASPPEPLNTVCVAR